jgi:Alpha/beta hydrolase domain
MNRIAKTMFAATMLLAASVAPAAAEVVRLEITSKTPYGSFRTGEYVLWRGKVHGELAPGEAIPDLDKAKRNEAGRVEYTSEIMLLMPADPSKGNGTLLVDIPNRGRVYGIALYNGPRGEPFNSGNIQQGTGFLEDRGLSLAEVQWELGKGVELPSFAGPDGKTRYVEGAGFAIVRDTADFLARGAVDAAGTPNPLRGAIDRVLASGKSQSGRFLKTFLLNGFNKVNGHRVVDGMHIFVSGSGLLPILTSSPGPQSSGDAAPSFADPEFRSVHEGPFTIGEIVATVDKRGEVAPKIVMVSSTTDFLSLRASLGRTGGAGSDEQALPATVRMYDIAGASHVVQPRSSECTLPLARLDWTPVSRATLVALDRWIASNVQPPDSKLMPLEPTTDADVLAAPRHLPKAVIERPKRDGDGNVLGGVRLPDIEAPLGVHAAQQEPKSFGCALMGAFLPFSEAQIAERYKNRDDYVNQIRTAARKLEAEGLLLPEDAAVIVNDAAAMPWPPSGKKK